MNAMRQRTAVALLSASLLAPTTVEAQRRPNFSGTWVLVEALAAGPGRNSPGGTASEGPRRTTSTTISGAPFNCGRECTISQKGQTLTIADAQLADYPGKDKTQPTPPVTLHLDGRQEDVVDSFSPSRRLPVRARWDGDKVMIESRESEGIITSTQHLSLEGEHLVVVSSRSANGEALGQTTFRYRKK